MITSPSESSDLGEGDDEYESNNEFQSDCNTDYHTFDFNVNPPVPNTSHDDSLLLSQSVHDDPELDFEDGFGNGLDPFEFEPDLLFPHDPTFQNRLHDPNLASLSIQDLQDLYSEELALPVGARLKYFWPRWRALGCSSFMLHKMTQGITLDWTEHAPPVTRTPPIESSSSDPVMHDRIKGSVHDLLSKQAIRLIHDQSPGFYSRLFMVPKKDSLKWRPVIDLSTMNKFTTIPHFKMETSEIIRAFLSEEEWTSSVDLQDAYFHMPIHPKFRKYFRFMFEGNCYEFVAMPFGLGSAPFEFSDQAKEFKKMALLLGFRINQYLDDWINRCLSFQAGRLSIIRLLHLILYLGFLPNFDKCEFEPSQDFEFIGTRYILHESRVTPTDKRKQSIYKACNSFQKAEYKSARQFMSLIGLLNATFLQVPQMGRLHVRPLQWHLHRYWIDTMSYGTCIPVPHKLNCHLKWWGCKSILDKGTDLHTLKPEVLVFTDASTTGWGAHCQGEDIQGSWDALQKSLHINILELRTILIALRLFPHLLRGKRVLILCDNSAAVSHLQKCGEFDHGHFTHCHG